VRIEFNGQVFSVYDEVDLALENIRREITSEEEEKCTWDVNVYGDENEIGARPLINAVRIKIIKSDTRKFKEVVEASKPLPWSPLAG